MRIIEDYRYTFVNDDDGHWYMIPEDLEGSFYLLLDAEDIGLSGGWEEFEQYKLNGGVQGITFTNPRGID